MKKSLLLIASLVISVFSSSLSAQCVSIVRDTITFTDPSGTEVYVRDYTYTAGGLILKRETRMSGTSLVFRYEQAYYNVPGRLDSVITFSFTGLGYEKDDILENKWTGSLLTKQIYRNYSDNSWADTTVYTYSGSTITSLTSMRTDSWEMGMLDNTTTLSGITFTGSNLTGGNYSENGSTPIPVTATYDAYANPFYGWAVTGDGADFLTYFSANNNISAYPTASPGTPFTTKSYTYLNNRMSSVSETYETGEASTKRFVYDCELTSILNPSAPAVLSSYPNPSADGKFHVNADNLTIQEVVVISSTGEVVSNVPVSVTASGIDIDLSNEAKGIYLVQFRGAKTVASAKLVKQ